MYGGSQTDTHTDGQKDRHTERIPTPRRVQRGQTKNILEIINDRSYSNCMIAIA